MTGGAGIGGKTLPQTHVGGTRKGVKKQKKRTISLKARKRESTLSLEQAGVEQT